jgi:hypothetical protein
MLSRKNVAALVDRAVETHFGLLACDGRFEGMVRDFVRGQVVAQALQQVEVLAELAVVAGRSQERRRELSLYAAALHNLVAGCDRLQHVSFGGLGAELAKLRPHAATLRALARAFPRKVARLPDDADPVARNGVPTTA